MPKFDPEKRKQELSAEDRLVVPDRWTEARCHVCQSQYRDAIDRLLALGTGFSEISRIFDGEIDRRSIARHAEKHLKYQEGAVRRIIETVSQQLNENAEIGVSSEAKRRIYLETALHKAMEQLVGDRTNIEVKDAVTVIDGLNKLDHRTSGAQLDEIKIQFQAFLQAIKEITLAREDPTLGSDILIRAREIAGINSNLPQLEKGEE